MNRLLDRLWDAMPDILLGLVILNLAGVVAATMLGNEEGAKNFLIGLGVAGASLLAVAAYDEWIA